MERNKNLSLEELKQQIEAMKRKVAEKERKLKKLEKAAESRRQNKVIEEKTNQINLQKDGSLKECDRKICNNLCSFETMNKNSEYKNKVLSLKETKRIDDNIDILQSTDSNLSNKIIKSEEFIIEDSKVCTKFEYEYKLNNSSQKIQLIESTLSSSKNITEKINTNIRNCSLLRRSARLIKQNKYSNNEHLAVIKECDNKKVKMEERLKIKSIFSYLIDKVKQMNNNDFILSNDEFCVLENKYVTKKTNFENLLKSELTEQTTNEETPKIVTKNRLNNINDLKISEYENQHEKVKENVSNNLLHCLKTENKESVRKIYQCVISEIGNELVVIQQTTTCSFWIKDSSRWKLNCTYTTENNIPINDCCLLCKNSVYFVESELQTDKFVLNLFHYDWKIGKLNKIYSNPNLSNRNSYQTLTLCKTEELTCAIMLSTDNESIIFILNLKEEQSILQSSLHFLDKMKCNITSLLLIEKLSQALLGCGRNHIYIWNYMKGKLVWESKTNKDMEVDNCFWVRAELGLLFLIISTDRKTKLSLIVLNPNTSYQAILRTYQHKQEILVSAQGNYLAVFDKDIISIYNIFSANKIAFANIKEVTVIAMMTDLLLGFNNGCSHFYQITKL